MELSLFEQAQKRKLTSRLAILLFGIALFYAAVCTPLYLILSSDVLWAGTPLPMLLDVVTTLANYAFYWIAFAYAAYIIYRLGIGAAVPMLGVCVGASVFRYSANLVAGFCVIGFPSWEDFASDYLPYFLVDIALELVMMAVAVGLAVFLGRKWSDSKGRLTDGVPFAKLFTFDRGMPRIAWLIACVPAAAQMLSRIRYDLSYGAPRGLLDLLWMVVYYCSDVLNVLLGYLVIVWIWNQIATRETEAKHEYDSATVI